MATSYQLLEPYGDRQTVQISSDDYRKFSAAQRNLLNLLKIEELLGVAAESYLEFETIISKAALGYMVLSFDPNDTERFFQEYRNRFDLKILNLLNAFRAHYEQSMSITKLLENACPGLHNSIKNSFSARFDTSQEYRIVDALRNFAQHDTLPLHSLSFGSQHQYAGDRRDEKSAFRNRVAVGLYFSISALVESNKINAKTRKEVEGFGVTLLDATLLIRKYVACVSEVHLELRAATEALLIASAFEIDRAYELAKDNKAKAPVHLELTATDPENLTETTNLKKDLPQTVSYLRTKFLGLAGVSRNFISSEPVWNRSTYQGSDKSLWISK
ncbi:hypothetical protein ACEN2J_13770 [Pseudorhodobacter sp. W20_MBD10_FR17]|uniref:hypothetical protein n=1 Tax=Pseudorhodobacter sp. W20_MBD10_FR17 TaxID=3240266 RepID=UPI003F970B9E